ncbi:uncharacterized protein M6B38_311920 [Iris pallida]|uniref:Uncharacterized protein n=1 Tax=Iris pallida TaxID=29817 RepID=A0AAX6GQC8_IRIPA|nr:uncharacterized protein M6B38_351535 [Iris pallida]KAJ6839870.1 uncharacterized protein M6B38_311920 [Iris pallida]
MAQMLKLQPSLPSLFTSRTSTLINANPNPKWNVLQKQLRCDGRHSCLFSDGRKQQEQARKALESALGGKKTEFEKWDKEIQKREQMGGGGASGGGGWFGGRWFGWFGEDRFWEEAQQAILAILGILSLYLLLAKGDVMFALVSNSLLFALRGSRNWFTFVLSILSGKASLSGTSLEPRPASEEMFETKMSAKERVVKKWGTD